MVAAMQGKTAVVRLLLDRGADHNLRTKVGHLITCMAV